MNMTTLRQGRPEDAAARLPVERACYDLLDRLGIPYGRVDHDEAATLEACEAVDAVLGAEICKNLFLCNRQKTQFYLLLIGGAKVFKTKYLSAQLGCARLSFAAPEDMERLLGVAPGSATVLALMNDPENAVQLVIVVHGIEQLFAVLLAALQEDEAVIGIVHVHVFNVRRDEHAVRLAFKLNGIEQLEIKLVAVLVGDGNDIAAEIFVHVSTSFVWIPFGSFG